MILPFISLQDPRVRQELCGFLTLCSSCYEVCGGFHRAQHKCVIGPQCCSKGNNPRLLSCSKTLPHTAPKRVCMFHLWWMKLRRGKLTSWQGCSISTDSCINYLLVFCFSDYVVFSHASRNFSAYCEKSCLVGY